jgi:hypothetical protein
MVAKVTTGQILRFKTRVPMQPSESVARTVMLVPAPLEVVGVPVMAPVLALSVKPAGSVPAEIAKEYGEVPPVALAVCE